MKSKVWITAISLALLIGAGVLSSFMVNSKDEPQKKHHKAQGLYVQTQAMEEQGLTFSITHRGRVAAYEQVPLAAEVNGRIMQGNVPFREGASFRKGELLLRIYSEDTEAALIAGKSRYLRTLTAVLPDLKMDFPDEYKKWQSFFAAVDVKKALPELPETHSEKEQVFLASQGVVSEYYSLRQQEIQLSKYEIYAPFNGTYQAVNRQVGAIANMGGQLATLIRTDKLEITVPVPIEDAAWITPGSSVDIQAANNVEALGTVSHSANFVDQATQSVNVYVNYLPKGQRALKAGQYAEVTFRNTQQAQGMEIPREALLNGQKVYTVENNRLKMEAVDVVHKTNDGVIISGIPGGKPIVTESLVDVEEGDEVEI